MTDSQIYDLFRIDYDSGFEALFNKYYKSLVIYSYGLTGRLDVAEDTVQTVFYKYLCDRKYDRVEANKLQSYLFIAVRNTSINYLNSCKISYPADTLMEIYPVSAEEKLYDEKLIATIKKQIEELPPRTRQVVKDIILWDMRYKEVGKKYGISVNTVKMLLVRGLKKLRKNMGEDIFVILAFLLIKE